MTSTPVHAKGYIKQSKQGKRMFFSGQPGYLVEPMSGRRWAPPSILREVNQRAAHFQERGLGSGDRVLAHHGNTLEFFADLLAVWHLGGCVIPIDGRLTPFEVDTLASATKPKLSLWAGAPEPSIASVLEPLDTKLIDTASDFQSGKLKDPVGRTRLDQDALILFTSGTTGDPKGVVHTHRSLFARWITLKESLGLAAFRHSLCLLPTHFGHGLICNCLFPWLAGQDLFILPPFRPELILSLGAILDEHKITFMSSVPSVWRLALKTARPPEVGSLQRVFCGSAPLSASLWTDIQRWTSAPEVFNSYGITETGSWLAGTSIGPFTPEDGLVGRPWGSVVRILPTKETPLAAQSFETASRYEAGYVWVNTPALMRGYLDRDDLTQQVVSQGWFFTGDIGLIDDREYLYLKGREREEVNKGGMKIYPGDIDAVVDRFPAILDTCAFAFDDSLLGQDIGIALVLASSDTNTIRNLYDWVRLHLASHQVPVRWYLLNEIPRTSRGKVNRESVAKRCSSLRPIDPATFQDASQN